MASAFQNLAFQTDGFQVTISGGSTANLAGSITATSSLSAVLMLKLFLISSVISTSTASGVLMLKLFFVSAVTAVSSASGSLFLKLFLVA